MKDVAQKIFRHALAAVDVRAAFERKLATDSEHPLLEQQAGVHGGGESVGQGGLRDAHLPSFDQILAVSFGKGAFAMAEGLQRALAPDFHVRGIISCPTVPPRVLAGWHVFVAGHPIPTAASFEAARAILDLLKSTTKNTLVFFLLSGGGSSLVELPLDPAISLEDVRQLHHALVTCGAPIEDINVIRKHLSAVKGGRLALAAPSAAKITLAISDVPEGKETALASGPTLPDPTTIADFERIIREHRLEEKLPASVRALVSSRALVETPKAGNPAFDRAHFTELLGMHDLFHGAHHAAEAAGFVCVCDNSTDNWPVERAADELLRQLDAMRTENPGRRVAVIADGEVSSPVTGNGTGGRNSAFVLACVPKIAGKNIAVLSAGTDGVDGNSPAAGAVADGETLARAKTKGLDPGDYFRRSDAFSFFESLGDAIHTGPTENNLRDLRVLLAW